MEKFEKLVIKIKKKLGEKKVGIIYFAVLAIVSLILMNIVYL